MTSNRYLSGAFTAILILLVSALLLASSWAAASAQGSYEESGQSRVLPPPQYWAVIVGISDYLSAPDLNYCDDDAQDIYNSLSGLGWQAVNMRLLKDSQATKSNIQSGINWMATNASSQDLCLFFFSGHGSTGPDVAPIDEVDRYDEYICPYDSSIYSSSTFIRDDELDAWLSPISAKKVVILDTCFSGGFVKSAKGLGETAISPTALGDGFAKDINKAGFVVLMSSNDREDSWDEPALQNGVFTYYLDQALSGSADVNGDGVSAEEAFAYAAPLTRSYVQNYIAPLHPGAVQNPQLYDGIYGEVILTPITTSTVPPSVTTSAAGNITANSATLNGNLTAMGTATSVTVSFQWGTTTAYGNVTPSKTRTAQGAFSANITGLKPNTTYHFRAKAIGSSTRYGNDTAFTTKTLPSDIETVNLLYGTDVFGWAINQFVYPATATAVTLADIEDGMPDALARVWYYDGPTGQWKFFLPGLGAYNTLTQLVPGRIYIGIVTTATSWEIPQ